MTRLEQLREDLPMKTSRVQGQLRQLRSGGEAEGREVLHPLMQQIRTHYQEAMRQAEAILTAERRQLVRSYHTPALRRGSGSAGTGREWG